MGFIPRGQQQEIRGLPSPGMWLKLKKEDERCQRNSDHEQVSKSQHKPHTFSHIHCKSCFPACKKQEAGGDIICLCLLRSLHVRVHTDEDWLCQDNAIFNLLLKVRFRYHRCQQHSFMSQQRNSSHIRLGFGRRQALGLLDFNKPIHVEGCLFSSSLTSTLLSTISHPLTAKDFSLAITIKWPL